MSEMSDETIEKWKEFVDLLIELFDANQLVWKETSDESKFLTSYADVFIQISKRSAFVQGERVPVIQFEIVNSNGRTVDQFDDEDLGRESNYYTRMNDLYGKVSRKVSGADDTLSALLKRMRQETKQDDDDIPF